MQQPRYIKEHYAGVVESRKRQATGTVVTIYRNDEAGLDGVVAAALLQVHRHDE